VRGCEKIPQEKLEQGSGCGIVLTGKFEIGGSDGVEFKRKSEEAKTTAEAD